MATMNGQSQGLPVVPPRTIVIEKVFVQRRSKKSITKWPTGKKTKSLNARLLRIPGPRDRCKDPTKNANINEG